MVRYLLSVLFLLSGLVINAQDPNFPIQKQFDPEVEALISHARAQMEANDFEGANFTFRKALATKKVLPTSMSYFFARTLFVIHQNQNALLLVYPQQLVHLHGLI